MATSCHPAFREDGFEERRIDIERLADAGPITSVIEKLLAFAENFYPDVGRHLFLGWGIDKLGIGWTCNFEFCLHRFIQSCLLGTVYEQGK
jgi:hypothetical protein